MTRLLLSLILVLAGALPALAFNGRATVALNMRMGPGVGYERVATIPAGAPVHIHRCLPSPAWCQVSAAGASGWSSARYLVQGHHHHHAPVPPVMVPAAPLVQVAPMRGSPYTAIRIVPAPYGHATWGGYGGVPVWILTPPGYYTGW